MATSLTRERWAAQSLYEQLYCERGDMEPHQRAVQSVRRTRQCRDIRANQLRLYLSAVAYVLISGLRRVGLKGTELALAQVSTFRTKLLKIGAKSGYPLGSSGFDGIQLSLAEPLPRGLDEPALLKRQRPPRALPF